MSSSQKNNMLQAGFLKVVLVSIMVAGLKTLVILLLVAGSVAMICTEGWAGVVAVTLIFGCGTLAGFACAVMARLMVIRAFGETSSSNRG